MSTGQRLRIGALQYFIRPVASFDAFAQQVTDAVRLAEDARCDVLVFPEYFSVQLFSLSDPAASDPQRVRELAGFTPRIVELFTHLAKAHGMTLVAGTTPVRDDQGRVFNDCHVVSPSGVVGVQGKLHLTRWEAEAWGMAARTGLSVFEAGWGRFAVAICYDSEFPEVARAAARAGCTLLLVPSCTDDRHGFLRVRYCCHARAVENTMAVVHAATVGGLSSIPSVALHYGSAAVLTPCDFPFARDGIAAEGVLGLETLVVADVDLAALEQAREHGTVRPLRDSSATAAALGELRRVRLA